MIKVQNWIPRERNKRIETSGNKERPDHIKSESSVSSTQVKLWQWRVNSKWLGKPVSTTLPVVAVLIASLVALLYSVREAFLIQVPGVSVLPFASLTALCTIPLSVHCLTSQDF